MPFDPTSRYYGLKNLERKVVDSTGHERVIVYKPKRLIPSYEDQPTLVEHRFVEGDRLDRITARHLGDPLQFWRICDANLVLKPRELEQTGRVIQIVMSPN